MSTWDKKEKDDIDICEDEIQIMLEPDEFGNRYVCVKVEDVIELLKEKGLI
jgi:hypothetical protein